MCECVHTPATRREQGRGGGADEWAGLLCAHACLEGGEGKGESLVIFVAENGV